MERKDYEELYSKQPKEIVNYIENDMLEIMNSYEIDDNMFDKIMEWRYILLRIVDKI